MARLRTIHQSYLIIKLDDPETAISEYMIRKLIKEGKIPAMKSGNRVLVDVDAITNYISNKTGIKPKE